MNSVHLAPCLTLRRVGAVKVRAHSKKSLTVDRGDFHGEKVIARFGAGIKPVEAIAQMF